MLNSSGPSATLATKRKRSVHDMPSSAVDKDRRTRELPDETAMTVRLVTCSGLYIHLEWKRDCITLTTHT